MLVFPSSPALVLASTSLYRRMLLERLAVRFDSVAPQVEEAPLPGEHPLDLVSRLAREKAEAVARDRHRSLVIGADQLAVCGQQVLGKPGTVDKCIDQLRAVSGRQVTFHTAVHVLNQISGSHEVHVDATTVTFRTLGDEEIRRYVAHEKPLDCAGGFKAEGLGIALFERIDSQDPTGLIGLPLIWLAGALRRNGCPVP